jgi:hypothetical protein
MEQSMKRDDKHQEKPKPPKQLKSVNKKERDSERIQSKQQLKNYWESGFEDDDFEDNFMR